MVSDWRIMKAYLKVDPSRIGEIERVFCLDSGQKRLVVRLDDGVSSIEGDVAMFEVIENEN